MIRELSISLKKCEERIDSMAAYEDIEAMNQLISDLYEKFSDIDRNGGSGLATGAPSDQARIVS